MKISTLRSVAGRACRRGTTMLALWLAIAGLASAGVGDLDVRYGTNGEMRIPGIGNAGGRLLEMSDGRLLLFEFLNAGGAAPRGSFAVRRFTPAGRPDPSFGTAGRVIVTLPLQEAWVQSAALQADGKVIVAGWGRANTTGHNVRIVACITGEGVVDTSFGDGGVVIGGEGGYGGYNDVLVLPTGEILAAYGEDVHRVVDRFDVDGRLTPGPQQWAPVRMALQADGRVVVIGQMGQGGAAWRLQRDGSLDASFGNGGYALLTNWNPAEIAIDPSGQRIVVCGGAGVERLTIDGRPDTSFGASGGLVSFDEPFVPDVNQCWGLLVNADGGVVFGADVYVVGLRSDGSPDPRFGAGQGYVKVSADYTPGAYWRGIGAVRTKDLNALFAWTGFSHDDFPGSGGVLVARVDLGQGASAGAVGIPLPGLRVKETVGTHALQVVRSGGSQGAASVRFESVADSATGADFTPVTGQLRWDDGDASAKTLNLPVTDDGEFEGEEVYRLRLFDAQGAELTTDTFAVTLVDDDALSALRFVDTPMTVKASAVAGTSVRVSRDDLGSGPLTAYYGINDGWDSCCTGRVSWAAGERGEKEIPLVDFLAGNALLYVDLYDAQGMLLSQAKVTIESDPPLPPATSGPPAPASSNGNSGGGGPFDWMLLAAGLGMTARRKFKTRWRVRAISRPQSHL